MARTHYTQTCLKQNLLLLHSALLLLLLPLVASAVAAANEPAVDEVAIMRRLRQALHDSGAAAMAKGPGWQLGNTSHPCTWDGVACTLPSTGQAQHVTGIRLECFGERAALFGVDPALGGGPLLPELAQLQWAESFSWRCNRGTLPGSIPPEWGAPNAWPRLKKLSILATSLLGGLPDVQPGALPLLEDLNFQVSTMGTTLPASWGASPRLLPALRQLYVHCSAPGALPAVWASGFRQLEDLSINGWSQSFQALHDSEQVAPSGAVLVRLPPEWAQLPGSFPKLRKMELMNVQASGPLPPAWAAGGFPSLEHLDLSFNNLTGTLPAGVLQAHPRLGRLLLTSNSFVGTLPEQWGKSLVAYDLSVASNALTGPAFPPAWLAPGRLPLLDKLMLEGNLGLTGTLPPTLWANLTLLTLDYTNVSGSVPARWCTLPVASAMQFVDFEHTRVDPLLPPCIFKILPPVELQTFLPKAPAAQQMQLSPRLLALAPAVVPRLAAVATLLLMALAAWRQRQRTRRQRQQGAHVSLELLGLLHGGQQQPAAGGAAGGGEEACAERQGRRARVGALLSAHVDGQGRGVQITPLAEQQQPALAHQLGRSSGAAEGWEWASSSTEGDVEFTRRLLHHASDASAGSEAAPPCSRQAPAALGSRQWGLPTQSLRVPAAYLEFIVDKHGMIVELGMGAYAVCYLAKLGGELAAVKVFELMPGVESGSAWREVALMQACSHRHVVPLLGVALKGGLLMVAMPFMQGGSLASGLARQGTRPALRWEASGRQVALDVAEALSYLHGRNVMHGDLKPGNILLSGDNEAYIADLGMARVMGGGGPAPGFTRLYAAPEQLLGTPCTLAADIYSLGMLLIVLITQRPLLNRGDWTLPQAPKDCPQGVVRLIQRCIQPNPEQRPSAAEVLQRLREEGGVDGRGGVDGGSSSAPAPQPLPINNQISQLVT